MAIILVGGIRPVPVGNHRPYVRKVSSHLRKPAWAGLVLSTTAVPARSPTEPLTSGFLGLFPLSTILPSFEAILLDQGVLLLKVRHFSLCEGNVNCSWVHGLTLFTSTLPAHHFNLTYSLSITQGIWPRWTQLLGKPFCPFSYFMWNGLPRVEKEKRVGVIFTKPSSTHLEI